MTTLGERFMTVSSLTDGSDFLAPIPQEEQSQLKICKRTDGRFNHSAGTDTQVWCEIEELVEDVVATGRDNYSIIRPLECYRATTLGHSYHRRSEEHTSELQSPC